MKPELFQKVSCKGYFKRIYDGRFIETFENEGKTLDCTYADTNNPDLNIECQYCGDLDFLKTYYEHRERKFSGIVVGFKDLVIDGYLTVATCYDHLDREYTKLGKKYNKTALCAIVYYANSRKRYVPLYDIEKLRKSINYVVRYNGWKIEVTADNKKQARHRAWVKLSDAYSVPYGEFMQNIEEVSEE